MYTSNDDPREAHNVCSESYYILNCSSNVLKMNSASCDLNKDFADSPAKLLAKYLRKCVSRFLPETWKTDVCSF